MSYDYKVVPKSLRRSEIVTKKSLSSKDYALLVEPAISKPLGSLLSEYNTGDTFSSKDFLTPDVCDKYRFIKTGNLSPHQVSVDFSSVEYCKPVGSDCLEEGDILVAKDGGKEGLGETSIYMRTGDSSRYVDFISGEILRLRIDESQCNKWYVLGILKSRHFKTYLDIVTPEGSTLRHSKFLSLDYKVPLPGNPLVATYLAALVENLVDKEQRIVEKQNEIDAIIQCAVEETESGTKNPYGFPRKNQILQTLRIDTGIYTEEYGYLVDKITRHRHGFYNLTSSEVKPGRTPEDYIYTDVKRSDTYLWITPSNIDKMQLLYETYIHTQFKPNTRDYSVILSGIRYLGNGHLVEAGEQVFSNQNTLVVNFSETQSEQIALLAYFTSSVGRLLQFAWRVDGLIPIIYSEDFARIPIPKFDDTIKDQIAKLYFCEQVKDEQQVEWAFGADYLKMERVRNRNIGIYQLNKERMALQQKIDNVIDSIVRGEHMGLKV